MTGDFSRWRAANAKRQGYSGVLMQQGRLYTDSDWNENLAILNERNESANAGIIGHSGTPKEAPGFTISPINGGFTIGAGSYWVNGLRVDNRALVSYADQGGGLDLEPLSAVAEGAQFLIYLVARKDEVSALGDPLLADPALSGVDTAVRERAHWRVGIREINFSEADHAQLRADARCGRAPDFPDWRLGSGRLRAGTSPAADLPDNSDCLIPPDAGYLSQENQLYRVQIVKGGSRSLARFVWSRENGSVEAGLSRNTDGKFVLQGARDDEALGFVSGGFVEIYDDRDLALGQAGKFARITLTDGTVTFTPALGDYAQMVNPRVRRWEHGGTANGLPLTTAPTALERGVEVSFTEGQYVAGDAWMFEARAATGTVIWPPYPGAVDEAVPPMNWGRHYAPLALARRSGQNIRDLVDLRAKFPSLVCLEAEDIYFDDSNCQLEAATVQQALEQLCKQRQGGLCTAVVRNRDELVNVVEGLAEGQNIRLCLAGNAFPLAETLRFQSLGHVIVEGAGPQTILSVASGETALLFEGCASVQVRDLSVNGGPNGNGGLHRGRRGALTMLSCGDVTVERVRARCRAGIDRASSCISSIGRLGKQQEVRVRDCTLKVGQAQIGIQVTGASRCIVENNLIQPLPAKSGATRARIAADRQQRLRISRALLRLSAPSAVATASLQVLQTQRPYSYGAIDRRTELTEAQLEFSGELVDLQLSGAGAVAVRMPLELTGQVAGAILQNGRSKIASATELRRYLRNLVMEAAVNGGRAVIAGRNVTLLPAKAFRTADTPFLAQGIVVGGDSVDEVRIVGNRIEDANDGIRVAASGHKDPMPPRWRTGRPPNHVAHARIEGNTITLNPLSSATNSYGILLGHSVRASISQNSVVLDRARMPQDSGPSPHFGIMQIGWRGPLLTISENRVEGMDNGIAVASVLSAQVRGLWRLRDNAAFGTRRAYITAAAVDVVV